MKKRLFLFLFTLITTLMISVPISAKDSRSMTVEWYGEENAVTFPCQSIEGISEADQNEITLLLKKYAKIRENDFLKISENNNTIFNYDNDSRINKIKNYEKNANLNIASAHISWQISDGIFQEDILNLTVREWTFVDYDDLYDDQYAIDTFGFGITRTITFQRTENGWEISSDKNPVAFMEEEINENINDEETFTSTNQSGTSNISISGTITPLASYNASAAVAYADKYALNYNPNYSNYNSVGGDCANFVSQCLYAGGLTMANDWYWYSYSNRSGSWTVVPNLKTAMVNRGYQAVYISSYGTSSFSSFSAGDVIMFGSGQYHTMICTGKDSAGRPYYNAHNTDQYHTPLYAPWYLSDGTTGYSYTVIKMNGSTHTHSYTRKAFEAAHPHKEYKYCSCGKVDWTTSPYTGNVQYNVNCASCKAIGKPTGVTASRSGKDLTVKWNTTPYTYFYNVYLVQSPWRWEDIKYTGKTSGNSYTFTNVKEGEYRAFVIARPNPDSVQSAWVSVIMGKPTDVSIYSSCTSCTVGSKIIFSFSAKNSGPFYDYTIADNTGMPRVFGSTPNSTFEWIPQRAGTYTAWVTASNAYGGTDSTKITIIVKEKPNPSSIPVASIALNQESLSLNTGNTAVLTAIITPNNATNKNVTWTSSDPSVATVENGKVTALKAGTATITVTTEDGNKTASCKVTVLNKIPAFSDVKNGDWFASSVYDLAGQGIISGMTETTFVPDGLITRAQFAKILAAASGENISSYTGKTSFSDVSPSAWYATYVQWAYEKGIVKGISDTSFAPEANITREQMAAMICRYAAYKGVNLPQTNNRLTFKDDASISGWAKNNVYAMQQAGIINGYADGNGYIFKPQGNATRAEAAKMISAFLSLK